MIVNLPLVSVQKDGFGTMAKEISRSLVNNGHKVVSDYSLAVDSDIILNFSHPHQFRYSDRVPSIGYMPWESTAARDGWIKHLSMVDDVWVTSPWLSSVVAEWGFVDNYVYEHGINPAFTSPRPPREGLDKIRFLHMGMEAYRKAGFETIRSFRKAFGNRDDVELILKTKATKMPLMPYTNVVVDDRELPFDQLIELYYSCDAFILPSYGEGFGLPARDAMSTGMPVIHTAGFAPYEDMFHPDLIIPSTLTDTKEFTTNSEWALVHPGKQFKPDLDATIDIVRNFADNFDRYSLHARETAPLVNERYDWNKLTQGAVQRVQSRFGIGL